MMLDYNFLNREIAPVCICKVVKSSDYLIYICELAQSGSFLTLFGIRGGDTFISLFFLDQILSAEFLSKNFKLF